MRKSVICTVLFVLINALFCESLLFLSNNVALRPSFANEGRDALQKQSFVNYRQRCKGTARYSMIVETLVKRILVNTFGSLRNSLVQSAGAVRWTVPGIVGLAASLLPNILNVVELGIMAYIVYAAVISVAPLFNPLMWSANDDMEPPIRGKR